MLLLIRGEKIAWNSKRLNLAVYNYIHRIVHDLKGEWVFFQNDFLNIFNEILTSQLVTLKKENAPFVALIRSILSKFFALLTKNPLLAVEAMFRFSDIITKDKILSDYDMTLPQLDLDEDGEPQIQKPVLPWSKEEDLILLENWDFFKDTKEPFASLSVVLHDQSFFREEREVKFRIKLLKIDKSKDTARTLIEETHSRRESLEEIVVKMLLYTIVRGRKIESQLFSYLREVCDEFEEYTACFTTSEVAFPVVPVTPSHFDLLSHPFVPSVFTFFGCTAPRTGQVFYRVATNVKLRDKLCELEQLHHDLKDRPEKELLEMGDSVRQVRSLRHERELASAAKGKKQTKTDKRLKEREELMRINRELAGLADSDDEDLDIENLDEDSSSARLASHERPVSGGPADDEDEADLHLRRRQVQAPTGPARSRPANSPGLGPEDLADGSPAAQTGKGEERGRLKRLKKPQRGFDEEKVGERRSEQDAADPESDSH